MLIEDYLKDKSDRKKMAFEEVREKFVNLIRVFFLVFLHIALEFEPCVRLFVVFLCQYIECLQIWHLERPC
jgi:hypothetical protein